MIPAPDSALKRAALVVQWGTARHFSNPRPGAPRILWWRTRFHLRIARRLAAASFNPPPGVDAAVLVVERRSPELIPQRQQAPFLGLLAKTHEKRHAPAADALAPIFSRRQLRRVLRDSSIDSQEPIGQLTIEQWSAINAAMVTLVDPARWPRRKPSWAHAGHRPGHTRG